MDTKKNLYIAATKQNDGKTTISLGLIHAFAKRVGNIGFIKPVGQRYVTVDHQHIDEDSVLLRKVCGLKGDLQDMSPVAIERGFTRRFLDDPDGTLPALEAMIRRSYQAAARGNEMVIVEGTGHAGVGSCFGLCNARVAELLGAKAIIVATGGIGRPLDEIRLSQALFEKFGVPVVGAIANKVIGEKLEQTKKYLSLGLEHMGLKLLGAIPYTRRLSWPNVRQIKEELGLELLNGEESLDRPVASVIVGAMTTHNALRHMRRDCVLITPGDREDLLLAVLMSTMLSPESAAAGVVLTGGIKPRAPARKIMSRTNIPVLLAQGHTYRIASAVNDMVIKIRETDTQKVKLACRIVEQHVDLDGLWRAL